MSKEVEESVIIAGVSVAFGLLIIGIIWALIACIGYYNVWHQGKTGEAALKKAEWTRQIAVREAMAKRDSAVMLAQAEIERAKGVAEANKIIGESLHNNESYLRYLWIDTLQNTQNKVIYIPTEASLPILEAKK